MRTGNLRNYKNTVQINFSERGDSFSLRVPHYRKWLSIIKFLRCRGFTITPNPYHEEHSKCLSKFHRIGYKGNVACLMEILAGSIHVEFGDIKNLWKDNTMAFWNNPSDERYTKLSYMEDKAVRLEIHKLLRYCDRYELPLSKEENAMSPEEYIINTLRVNSHIHGKVECLDDIRLSIKEDSYDWKHNSNDANKKKIICGDKKYFYDYKTDRLSCGIAWHNINNMWWVISGGKLRNIVCWELFDYSPDLPRRKPADASKVNALLKKFISKQDFLRCNEIKKYHGLLKLEAA